MKFDKANMVLVAGVLAVLAIQPAYAGLDQMVMGASNMIASLARLLTIGASLLGGFFVISGVMAWKKSSDEHGGQQVEFKSVVVPIISGVVLVAFTGFLLMTSQTFGFASPNITSFG